MNWNHSTIRVFLGLISVLAGGGIATAQSIQPVVVGSAGEHFVAGNAQLSFTAGEVVIETYISSDPILTQGFHRPDLNTVPTVEDNLPGFLEVKVYPNPTAALAFIEFENNSMELNLNLYTMNGKRLHSQIIPAYASQVILNIGEYSNASYLLQLRSTDDEHFATYRLQKLK